MSHAQSLLFPPCLTSSAHSTRTSNPTPSLSFSHGDDHCDDPQNVAAFGPLAKPVAYRRRPRLTTHGSGDRGDDAEEPWDSFRGSEFERERISVKALDEHGSIQAVTNCASALEMHEEDRAQPQQSR